MSVKAPEAIETRFDLSPSFEVLKSYLFVFVNFIDLLLECVAKGLRYVLLVLFCKIFLHRKDGAVDVPSDGLLGPIVLTVDVDVEHRSHLRRLYLHAFVALLD